MSTLFVFDIDGTLLYSATPHRQAFFGPLRGCSFDEVDADCGGYVHHTDSWIFREVFRRNRGRLPEDAETHWFVDRLHAKFLATAERDAIEHVSGAASFLRGLDASDGYTVAFAHRRHARSHGGQTGAAAGVRPGCHGK